MTKEEMKKVLSVNEDESLAEFGLTGQYVPFHCVVPKCEPENLDISGCLEDTLHRIWDSVDEESTEERKERIADILGAIPDSEVYDVLNDEQIENDELLYIDLGYVLPGLITYFTILDD